MSELEKSLKEQLETVIKDNQRLLEKHFKQDSELVKLIGEKEYYKSQLQQKENIMKSLKEYLIKIKETSTQQERIMAKYVLEYIEELEEGKVNE